MEYLEKVLYLNPLELTGPEQMAIDLFLLEKSFTDESFNMAIRFYTWDGDWLSIGKNQKEIPEAWLELFRNKKLKVVRRPSGGKAVLHSRGLTYALIWKNPPKNKKESYLKITQWLKDGFEKAGVDLFFGNQSVNIANSNCFATSTLADLVDKDKNKLIGSAQYWQGGNLLQHGEILLDPPIDLWGEVFNTTPPQAAPNNIPRNGLIDYLTKNCVSYWSRFNWIQNELGENELDNIFRNSKSYYIKLSDPDK